jgi:hypothetical protein
MLSLLEDRLAWMPWPNGSPFGVKSKRLILGLICIVSLGLLSPRAISQLCCFLERFDSDNCIFIKDMWSAKIFTIKVKHEMLHFPWCHTSHYLYIKCHCSNFDDHAFICYALAGTPRLKQTFIDATRLSRMLQENPLWSHERLVLIMETTSRLDLSFHEMGLTNWCSSANMSSAFTLVHSEMTHGDG